MVTVISLGGSIVAPAPAGADVPTIASLVSLMREYLQVDGERRLVLVIGGGGIARAYQQAYRGLVAEPSHVAQDWIGIMATRVNAELLRAALGELCADPVLSDPTAEVSFGGRVLVGAGWKPGFSTDYIAVLLAEHFGAQRIINISNIEKVYSSDPALDPDARPLDKISWAEYQALIGAEWTPGRNLPFDPVASKRAAELGMEVLLVSGKDMANITMVLEGGEFFGSRIGN